MSGVIFTQDADYEIAMARQAAEGTTRRFFVYGRDSDVAAQRAALPDFEFVPFEKTTAPEFSRIQHETGDGDLFVLHHTYPAKIPDRNLGTYQSRTRGTKLVVEEHPFCGKGMVWPLYFPFSYVDKSLIGYPHSYAFRDATDPQAWDVRRLAERVREHASTTMAKVFNDDIETVNVSLTAAELNQYGVLKEVLFDEEPTPHAIIKKLKAFVDSTESMRTAAGKAKALPLLDLNKVWPAYKSGLRRRFVSDAKVDLYLAGEFDKYISNANAFLEALHG